MSLVTIIVLSWPLQLVATASRIWVMGEMDEGRRTDAIFWVYYMNDYREGKLRNVLDLAHGAEGALGYRRLWLTRHLVALSSRI